MKTFLIAVAAALLVVTVSGAQAQKYPSDLIALAKQKPGQIMFGSSGTGSGTHMGGELLKLAAGINIVHVAADVAKLAKVAKAAGIKID